MTVGSSTAILELLVGELWSMVSEEFEMESEMESEASNSGVQYRWCRRTRPPDGEDLLRREKDPSRWCWSMVITEMDCGAVMFPS
jgi:hypothetical protein